MSRQNTNHDGGKDGERNRLSANIAAGWMTGLLAALCLGFNQEAKAGVVLDINGGVLVEVENLDVNGQYYDVAFGGSASDALVANQAVFGDIAAVQAANQALVSQVFTSSFYAARTQIQGIDNLYAKTALLGTPFYSGPAATLSEVLNYVLPEYIAIGPNPWVLPNPLTIADILNSLAQANQTLAEWSLSNQVAVPEPSTGVTGLLAAGLIGITGSILPRWKRA